MPSFRALLCALVPAVSWLLAGAPALADDWTNAGGNAGRNGLSTDAGPQAPDVLWTGGAASIISWQPLTSGGRVFLVRQTSFVPNGVPNDATIYCHDLATGMVLWKKDLPYNMGDWTTWVAGASAGHVYASRSGNGNSVLAKVYALDETTGNVAWTSKDTIGAGAYDGVVFAPGGDLVVGEFAVIKRISATDGTTVWKTDRVCSVSGNCGVAVHGTAVYAADAVAGGHVIKRFDLQTGAFQYQSPVMAGFTLQNSPMVGPDGTVYLSRTQNNVAVDKFYAFKDTGLALEQKWAVPAGWSTSSEFAVGADGGVYMLAPGDMLARLDPATGAVLAQSGVVNSGSPRLATDKNGVVFLSNGGFPDGKLFVYGCDLTPLWSTPVQNINIGAPALGQDGTLVVAGTDKITAYRSKTPPGPTECGGVGGGGTGGSGGAGGTGGSGGVGGTGGTGGAAGAGGSGGSGGEGGSGGLTTSGSGGVAGAGGDTTSAAGGSGGEGGSGGDGGTGGGTGGQSPQAKGGCGCRTAPAAPREGLWATLALGLALARRSRRSRRSARSRRA